MKKQIIHIGNKFRHLSTRGSLFGILLSHACCLPALAGLAGFSLSAIQFVGPQFHLIIKIVLVVTVILQVCTMIYRIASKQFTWRYVAFYSSLFASLALIMYSLWYYVDPMIVFAAMGVLVATSVVDMFVKKKKSCCHV